MIKLEHFVKSLAITALIFMQGGCSAKNDVFSQIDNDEISAGSTKLDGVLTQSKEGMSPLYYAIKNRASARTIRNLLQIGANPFSMEEGSDKRPVTLALYQSEAEIFRQLINKSNVNTKLTSRDNENSFFLDNPFLIFMAVQTDNLEKVEILIDRGADLSAANRHGQTPVISYNWTNSDVVEKLIKSTSDLGRSDAFNQDVCKKLFEANFDGPTKLRIANLLRDCGAPCVASLDDVLSHESD